MRRSGRRKRTLRTRESPEETSSRVSEMEGGYAGLKIDKTGDDIFDFGKGTDMAVS